MLFPRRVALFCLYATLFLLWPSIARAQRYVNVVNKRFATVSNGPQSALVVDVPGGAGGSVIADAVKRRVRADWTARTRALAPQVEQARRMGVLKGRGTIPISTLVTVRQNGRMVAPPPSRSRQVGGGTLTFTYTGFAGVQINGVPAEEFLRRFQELAYPRIQNLYGAPSWSGNVEVVNMGPFESGQATQVQRLAFGAFDVSNRRILLPLYQNVDDQAHALLLLMVHAFHGPAYFQYDAWEQGFARAAASIVARDPVFGFLDATANNKYSLLLFYDLLNQPPLANPTFFPPSQANVNLTEGVFSIGKMFFPRLGMSGAAWLKVYIENPNFFRNFNAAYYARFDPNAQPSLAGNVPVLRQIASDAVREGRPDDSVEGLPFQQWYERQYILDTSVAPGEKLFAFVIPADPDTDNGQSALIVLIYFRTKANGDEELLQGRAYATYFDASNARVNLGPASEQAAIIEGEGFITTLAFPSPGFDAGRITMDFHVGNETARSYLPSGFSGDFQGVVLGLGAQQGGTVTVRQTTLPPVETRTANGTLENGGFGVNVGTRQNDLAVTIVDVTVNNATTSYRVNTGDGRYFAVIRSDGAVRSVAKTFEAGLALVSFPLRPLATDVSTALGLSPTDFLLSYWDPATRAYQTFAGQPPGPSIAPLQPGRGYWLKVAPADGGSRVTVNLTGVQPPDDTDLTIGLPYGWNLVGNPFAGSVRVDDLLVQYLQNDAISWADAVARNLVAAQPFAFNPQTGVYATTDALTQWNGYWLRVLVPSGVTLILPAPNSPTGRAARVPGRVAAAPAAAARPEWSVNLRARGGATGPATATFGAVRGASAAFDNRWDREAPPTIAPGVTVEFPHTDWKSAGGRFVADYRDAGAGRVSWDVNVTAPVDGDVTLTWEGLGTVPRRTRLTLVDKATGRRTALRSRSAYTFSGVAGQSRAFQIVAEPERSALLAISDVTVVRTRAASSLTISYAVTDEADVTVDVKALGGRTLRRLSGGRAQRVGRQSIVWDGRTSDGSPVPAGPYTVEITARGADGTLARQIRPVLMLR